MKSFLSPVLCSFIAIIIIIAIPLTKAADSSSFVEGDSFVNQGTTYTQIINLFATKTRNEVVETGVDQIMDVRLAGEANLPQAEPNNYQQNIQSDNIIEHKGSLAIRLITAKVSALSTNEQQTSGNLSGYPVVRNSATGVLGVVLGNINIKINEGYDAQTIADEYGANLLGYVPGSRLAFLRFSTNLDNLVNKLVLLENDLRIQRAGIEIIEHSVLPN